VRRLCCLLVFLLASVSAQAEAPVILVFGDSISAGYGLERVDQGWVELLRTRLKTEGYGYQVVNASVSGETTAGGLARLPRALELHHPKIVILELGGNDGLRALPVPQMRENFAHMADLATHSGAKVLILGMRIPPNYGPQYTSQFEAVYGELSRADKLPLVPFLMDRIALTPELMQGDDIHPNVKGQPVLLDNVWPVLQSMLKK
jgi:acyl-CoA thioesterase-1